MILVPLSKECKQATTGMVLVRKKHRDGHYPHSEHVSERALPVQKLEARS